MLINFDKYFIIVKEMEVIYGMEQAQVLTFLNNENRDLLLQFCGYSTTEPLHSFGPVVRPHYIIHFILNGKGIFQIREKTYHLETGQGFLI